MSDAVPPNVREDQLELLLEEQHESDVLDYKSELDLLDPEKKAQALVETAKDVGAMASGRGGHLVIGADEKGKPTGLLSDKQADQLDEARLRPKLERYLPDGLDIRTAVHRVEGNLVGLIYVGPHADGLVIMRRDGSYSQGGKERQVFREGEIFIRRGTESRRIGQAELRKRLDQMRHGSEGEALSWDLNLEALVAAVTEQLRRGDEIPVRLLLDSAPAVASRVLTPNLGSSSQDLEAGQATARERLADLLDRIAAIAARALVLEAQQLLDLSVTALESIYNGVFDERGFERRDLAFEPEWVWLMVIERVYALGALAVRKKRWGTVAELALRWPTAASGERAWLRHGYVMAARRELLKDPESPRSGSSLLKLALDHIVAIPQLRPDYDAGDERLLNSLTQFDVLANLAVMSRNETTLGRPGYPHFRRFNAHRSDPAVVALIDDAEARTAIFPRDDEELAEALRALAEIDSGEFFYLGGWDEYEGRGIRRLLEEHPLR
jgi:hypothetical protein